MKKAVFCIAQDTDQANHIVNDLHKYRFPDDAISILMADKRFGSEEIKHSTGAEWTAMNVVGDQIKSPGLGIKKESMYSEGAATGAAVGGILGGTLGLLAGIGTIAIPGIGPLIAAGPIMAALGVAGAGAGAGHILGGLAGAGYPKYRIDTLPSELEKGRIFISVYTDSEEQAELVKRVFEEDGAIDIASSNIAA